jgi:tRNA (adenine37-N6)-methyltransferase
MDPAGAATRQCAVAAYTLALGINPTAAGGSTGWTNPEDDPCRTAATRRTTPMPDDGTHRPGEVSIDLPGQTDSGVYFIGRIRTPWITRESCPRKGDSSGPDCVIEVDPRWALALEGLSTNPRIQVLYWMHQARRDLALQTPRRSGQTTGTFALRSPARPNPIASSVVDLIAVAGNLVTVRGLDCLDGTPLIDIKPARGDEPDRNDRTSI